jgi:Immunity protein Imm1
MLVIWRPVSHTEDTEQRIDDVAALDVLLDQIHLQALTGQYPHDVVIYAGNRYPQGAHHSAGRYHPDDPGDGKQPELTFVLGTDQSPLYWNTTGDAEETSTGPHHPAQPEPRYFFEYWSGGQESYATESSLVPIAQAREAARQFVASGGQRPANITWHIDHEPA